MGEKGWMYGGIWIKFLAPIYAALCNNVYTTFAIGKDLPLSKSVNIRMSTVPSGNIVFPRLDCSTCAAAAISVRNHPLGVPHRSYRLSLASEAFALFTSKIPNVLLEQSNVLLHTTYSAEFLGQADPSNHDMMIMNLWNEFVQDHRIDFGIFVLLGQFKSTKLSCYYLLVHNPLAFLI